MVKQILGQKLRMTRLFTEEGKQIPLTAIQAGPCPIVQIKTVDHDGYNALQIGFSPKKEKRVNRPEEGHFKKAGVIPQRVLKEIRVTTVDDFSPGQNLDTSLFEEGEHIDITGISKGCGFQGGVKRHNWGGGRDTHGSMFHRAIGSIGPGTGMSRIWKGKTLPGHMGHEKITIQNMEIVKIDKENNIIYVKGGVPGPEGSIVFIKTTSKTKQEKLKK